MYSKKAEKKLVQQFKRDGALGFPYHTSDNKPAERDAFISALVKSKTFAPTCEQNYEKFKDSVKETVKKFNTFDYFCIAMFTLSVGGFAYLSTSLEAPKTTFMQQHQKAVMVVATLLGFLAGAGLGFANQVSSERINKDNDSENLYNRLSVRLFDVLREKYSDLDENVLKACNPEMARVIRALVIANMPENDVREIQAIATTVAKQLRDATPKTEKRVFHNCNEAIKTALSIIEQNLITNPQLHDAILSVYRGGVPAQFILQKPQNSR